MGPVVETTAMPASDTTPPSDRDASDVRSVVARYRRAERAASWTLALLVAGAFLAAVAALSFWPSMAVGAVLVAALRVPAVRRGGSTRLRTDAPPAVVVREFASARPPNLAFQWGVADAVRPDDGDSSEPPDTAGGVPTGADATYEFTYLFGLKTVELDLSTDVSEGESPAGDAATDGARETGGEHETDGVRETGGEHETNGVRGTDGEHETDDRGPVATVEIEGTTDGRPWASYAVAVREAADGGSVVDVELRPTRRFDLRRLPQGWIGGRYYADALAAQGYEVIERSVSLTR